MLWKKLLIPKSFLIGTNQRFSDLSLPPWLSSNGELGPHALDQAKIYKPRTSWDDTDRIGKRQKDLSPNSWQDSLTRRNSSKCQVHQGRTGQESQNEAWPLRSSSLREHLRMWILERCPENGWEREGRISQAQLVGGPELLSPE